MFWFVLAGIFFRCPVRLGFVLSCPWPMVNTRMLFVLFRAVTKISSCWVNTTNRRGNQTARGVFWFHFSLKIARVHVHSSRGKSPALAS